jgi:SAM-dependent methyltransferase
MLEQENKGNSTVFKWNPQEVDFLLKSCKKDDGILISLKYLKDKNAKILEAGCGLGRVVKYLSDLGFKNVYGVEIDKDSVCFLNQNFPELNVVCADLLQLPYPKESFDVVLSYGVIEHFPGGPDAPLKAMYDVLKPGGIAVITVPSFNFLRRWQYRLSFLDIRKINFIRKFFGKKLLYRNRKKYSYFIDPQYGNFFEFRFTPRQYENICRKAGFKIIESAPISHIDGFFHTFGSRFVTFKDWEFKVSRTARVLNWLLSKIPFLHNHMHVCVVKK